MKDMQTYLITLINEHCYLVAKGVRRNALLTVHKEHDLKWVLDHNKKCMSGKTGCYDFHYIIKDQDNGYQNIAICRDWDEGNELLETTCARRTGELLGYAPELIEEFCNLKGTP